MLLIVIGIVAAALGLLDYLEIVDTPTSLVLTGVGAVVALAGVAQLQKDKRAVSGSPAAPTTNGHTADGLAPANALATRAAPTNGTAAPAEKPSLWQRMNKPVGGEKQPKEGKHRSRRSTHAEEHPEPAIAAAPAAGPAAPAAPVARAQDASQAPEAKTSFWKKLNQPMGKGPMGKGKDAPSDGGDKKRRRRNKKDEDEGPLFPETMTEGPDPFAAAPPADAIPPAPVPVAPAASRGPEGSPERSPEAPQELWDQPPAAPPAPADTQHQVAAEQAAPAPGAPTDVLWDLPPQEAPLQGTAAGPGAPQVPDQPAPIAATAVAEAQAQAPVRGRRVCNYCWEPNDPGAAVCSACGAGL